MADTTLVVFDTSTLPEYYDDVHKIIALPEDFIVTYDYQENNIETDAKDLLDRFCSSPSDQNVVLAYMQGSTYKKGGNPPARDVLPTDAITTFTRLARLVAVRKIGQLSNSRYYLDLSLLGYPYDRKQELAKEIVQSFRTSKSLPMLKYVMLSKHPGAVSLFKAGADDEQGFAAVLSAIGHKASQFGEDTFWRVTNISSQTKSLIPFRSTEPTSVSIKQEIVENKASAFFEVVDQSVIFFDIQFHRARESDTKKYRIRRIQIDSSPKSLSDANIGAFPTRSYGREKIALRIPATTSLSTMEVRYAFDTLLHQDDEFKDYPYGPRLTFVVRYRKAFWRLFLSVFAISFASGLFAWAAYASSTSAGANTLTATSLCFRVGATVAGVLLSLYAYYLWNDDVSLEKGRK